MNNWLEDCHALWNCRPCLVFKQWLVKASTRAVAHCASSFLFVAEWSWQQAQAGSGLQHTPCQKHILFLQLAYIPCTTQLYQHCWVLWQSHISSPWGTRKSSLAVAWVPCSLPSACSSWLRNLVGLAWHWACAVLNQSCLEPRPGQILCTSCRLWRVYLW